MGLSPLTGSPSLKPLQAASIADYREIAALLGVANRGVWKIQK
jgi:hypothetical protein